LTRSRPDTAGVRWHEFEVKPVPVRRDYLAVRQQVAGVLEEDEAVAQQTPALLRVGGYDMGGLPVWRGGRRARRLMLTIHDRSPWSWAQVVIPISLARGAAECKTWATIHAERLQHVCTVAADARVSAAGSVLCQVSAGALVADLALDPRQHRGHAAQP
jgi:hypothetical protein